METPERCFGMCRAYVRDHAHHLSEAEGLLPKIEGFLRSRDIARLSTCSSLVEDDGISHHLKRTLLQIEAFFKKNAAFSIEEVCAKAAEQSFRAAELQCEETNRRVRWLRQSQDAVFGVETATFTVEPDGHLRPDGTSSWVPEKSSNPRLVYQVKRARLFIEELLGSHDEFLEELPKLIRLTSGATATTSRRKSLPHLKVRKSYVCTLPAAQYLRALGHWYGYGTLRLKYHGANRIEVVPKNWKTHRTIACEPMGNLPLQLAFDTYAKSCLRRKASIDLSDQSRNQRFAERASNGENISTLDLSAASDTVSYEVVATLFPWEWFNYLDRVRSRFYVDPWADVPGSTREYAKFSSMGNGSTFAIETLIFAACCHAVGAKRGEYTVYGDDISIDRERAEDLTSLLTYLGFTVNREKSHYDGLYHESCGMHWFRGHQVTPFYVRWNPSLRTEWCHLVNGLVSLAVPNGELEKLVFELIEEFRLPLVPYNGVSTSGVWIDAHHAYQLKVLRTPKKGRRAWRPTYLAYVTKNTNVKVQDLRGLFLWYLRSGSTGDQVVDHTKLSRATLVVQKERWAGLRLYRSSSSVPQALEHRFVRKRVDFVPQAWHPAWLYHFSTEVVRVAQRLPHLRIKSTATKRSAKTSRTNPR